MSHCVANACGPPPESHEVRSRLASAIARLIAAPATMYEPLAGETRFTVGSVESMVKWKMRAFRLEARSFTDTVMLRGPSVHPAVEMFQLVANDWAPDPSSQVAVLRFVSLMVRLMRIPAGKTELLRGDSRFSTGTVESMVKWKVRVRALPARSSAETVMLTGPSAQPVVEMFHAVAKDWAPVPSSHVAELRFVSLIVR